MILRNQYLSERLNEIKMQDDLALLSDSEDMNLLLYPYYDLKGQFFHLERYDWEKLNIPMAGTARTGGWCQPIRANVPMVLASEPLITSFNSVYFSH